MQDRNPRTYWLNGLIGISVKGPARYLAYFDNEYTRISAAEGKDGVPLISLEIVRHLDGADMREIHYKDLFTFRYEVSGLDSKSPTIRFEQHWLDLFYVTPVGAFVQGQILEPVIYQKLLQEDVLFMHCAGVARDGKAYVFPAHGGTGKTTLSLSLMKMGYDLMGDDLLMVDTRNGEVHPYARPLHLFEYNLKSLSVPLRIRLAIAAKSVIRKAIAITTGRKFLISTRVHADEFLSVRHAKTSKLAKLVFLKRDGDEERFDLSNAEEKETAVQMVVNSADLNESLAENIGMPDEIYAMERAVVSQALNLVGSMTAINARAMKTDADRQEFAESHCS